MPPTDRVASPAKTTRASRVALALRQAILRGDLAPGSKVNLDELREGYGVSLSPMREAMARLVADGLVDFEDQRGYRIAPVSRENLVEVTRMRADLDCLALGYAIANGGIDWESRILAALHRLTRSSSDAADAATAEAWETAHTEFHFALIAGCGMPVLLNFCSVVHNLNDRYRRMFLPTAPADRRMPDDHRAMAEATVARDSATAIAVLRAHIERTGSRLAECIDAALPDNPAPNPRGKLGNRA